MGTQNTGARGPRGGQGSGPVGDGGPAGAILQAIADEFAELSNLFHKLSRTQIGGNQGGSQSDGVDFTPQIAFREQPQERYHWCWLAVAASVKQYFENVPTEQFDLANKLLKRTDCKINESHACDQGGALDDALEFVRHLAFGTMAVPNPVEASMTFEDIAAELEQNKKPLCIYIDWGGAGEGHFCVISGCKEVGGEQYLYINDPLFGDGPQPYARVRSNYNLEQGTWAYTYRLKA